MEGVAEEASEGVQEVTGISMIMAHVETILKEGEMM